MTTPNPGSREAIQRGCTCPVMDNWHGDPELGRIRGFIYVEGCPLHSATPPNTAQSEAARSNPETSTPESPTQ